MKMKTLLLTLQLIVTAWSSHQVFKDGYMPIVEESTSPDDLYDAHHEFGCGNRLTESSCGEDPRCEWYSNPEFNYLAWGMYTYQKYCEEKPEKCDNSDTHPNYYDDYRSYSGVGESSTKPSDLSDAEKKTSVFHITYNDGTSPWCQHNPDPKSIKFHHSTRSNDSNTIKNDAVTAEHACSNICYLESEESVSETCFNMCGNDKYVSIVESLKSR